MRIIQVVFTIIFIGYAYISYSKEFKPVHVCPKYEQKVDSVLRLLTLEEKIGQLNQYTGNWQATGPVVEDTTKLTQVRQGLVGSMLNIRNVVHTRELQQCAMESRMRIPLLFGLDVIHGMRTIFPIPLAEAASFDIDLIRRTAQGAALETSAQGVHWTFAPMVDISRDARWGRVMEGAGEDTWYGSLVAAARVKGFQGDDLSDPHTIMACVKHFAAYGAAIAGKDYNTVDISEVSLHQTYLPPFKAALTANVATFMNSFNDINGIPATGHTSLQRDILYDRWQFNGFMVSDWGSIGEMVPHGFCADLKEAAYKAIVAGCHMDMESRAYNRHLKELVESKQVDIALIDDAVRRILAKKFELGLFDDPFRYCDSTREQRYVLCDELRNLSREAGRKSIVLLKNSANTLPLRGDVGKIAVVGALAKSKKDMLGFWANEGVEDSVVTIYDGLKQRFGSSTVRYAEGYDLETFELKDLKQTMKLAAGADVVIVVVGERSFHSGEAKSRADININRNHQRLVTELKKSGRKVVVLVCGGRPLIFNEMEPDADAILMTWWLGSQAGNAIADVVCGDYNPSAKLPMTFPRHIGQVPIYYDYKSTGRPEDRNVDYSTKYQDIAYTPAYPFGYGLSYTAFEIGTPMVDKREFDMDDTIKVSVDIKNIGNFDGMQTVQLYVRDLVASLTRPVKELKAFRQVYLESAEKQTVVFELTKQDLAFVNSDLDLVTEPGEFVIMVGENCENTKSTNVFIR